MLRYLTALLLSWILILNSALAESNSSLATQFQLRPGDLLFQDLNCGEFCDSVDKVTFGYQNTYVSHVAMIVRLESQPQVIEAVSAGVTLTPLAEFLARSQDANKQPRVMVGRVQAQYQYLIPKVISFAMAQLGKPYNSSFMPNPAKAYYCSELIETAYTQANPKVAVFHRQPMSFTAGQSPQILPLWHKYYAELKLPVPQGVLGSNPGLMSRESSLQIIYFYGKLRQH